ncbi:MAG: hypothetical protein ACXIUM_04445 [Wenzhouxiangella sp.]
MNVSPCIKVGLLALSLLLLSGCVTTHQPRYGFDGVYFDQWHAAPSQVVIVDPTWYPFWSLDFFYFSHFPRRHGPFFAHDPWFWYDPWRHPRQGWATRVIWVHPVVYTAPPPADQRLVRLQQPGAMPRQPRQTAWREPGSEVQLRHRLAEDRAAASHRSLRGGGAVGSPSTRSGSVAPAPRETVRSPQQRPAAVSRPAPIQRVPERQSDHRGARPQASPPPRPAAPRTQGRASLREAPARERQR